MLAQIVKLGYIFFSNLLNPNKLCVCRFEPSCTTYAAHAVDSHGSLRGSLLILRRLIKCQPWGPFGFDPVPPKKASQD